MLRVYAIYADDQLQIKQFDIQHFGTLFFFGNFKSVSLIH